MVQVIRGINLVLLVALTVGGVYSVLDSTSRGATLDLVETAGMVCSFLPLFVCWKALGRPERRGWIRLARASLSFYVFVAVVYVVLGFTMRRADEPLGWVWFGLAGFFLLVSLANWRALSIAVRGVKSLRVPSSESESDLPILLPEFSEELSKTRNPDGMSQPSESKMSPLDARSTMARSPVSGDQTRGNYFLRHWRGELSLGVSYWVNGSVVTVLFVLGVAGLNEYAIEGETSLIAAAWLSVLVIIAGLLITIWSLVGIWRSAGKHESRGGTSTWARLARIAVVLGTLSVIGTTLQNTGPQLIENARIAFGFDPIGTAKVTLSADGRSVLVKGGLGAGTARAVTKLMEAAPAVRVITLDSHGGRIKEAEQLAALVKKRRMGTYVEGQCLSACTLVLLAGIDRAATPNARIGFHQFDFPGLTPEQRLSMKSQLQSDYASAGLSGAFVQKILATPPDQMWHPSRAELIEARVLTRLTFGGEHASLATLVESREDLALMMRESELFREIERAYPSLFSAALDRGWKAVQSRLPDADVLTAMRGAATEVTEDILRRSDDAQLVEWAQLVLNQLKAARAIGYETCGAALAGTLNINQALPAELGRREEDLQLRALRDRVYEKPVRQLTPQQKRAAYRAIFERTRESTDDVVRASMDGRATSSAQQCEAVIDMYEVALSLPPTLRGWGVRVLAIEK